MAESQLAKTIPSASRRRDKPQLSCTLCRRRKLRCDRAQPCETCIRRGLSLSCTYVHSSASERIGRSQVSSNSSTNLPNRIEQLEQLVVSLMSAVNATKLPEEMTLDASISVPVELAADENQQTTSSAQLLEHFGSISLESSETPHWNAVLDGIAELKDFCQDDNALNERHVLSGTYKESDRPEILFGNYKYFDRNDVLAAIPPRPVVDRLVAEYCNNSAAAPPIIHIPTFLKEYDRFWEQPQETPIIWVGLLFSVMCLATFYQRGGTASWDDRKRQILPFKERIPQCLSLGKYTSDAYAIETLIIYLYIEYADSEDSQVETLVLMGVVVNLALQKGYNRDPSHSPYISPFQGEMKRRVWALIKQFDAIAAAQAGVPRMVRESHSDTAEPLNLLDEDLDEYMAALPLPRPDTAQTVIQYIVAQNKIAAIYGEISDTITSIKQPSYSEVMRLDKVLHATYTSIPSGLHPRPMAQSLMDSSDVIIHRFYILLLFQKAQCVLHYKYMIPARTDSRFVYSRSICLEAALRILDTQWTLDQERQVGGRLYQAKVQSLIKSTFYLAATLLCLDLDYGLNIEMASPLGTPNSAIEERQSILRALYNAYLVWRKQSNESKEARKATDVLSAILSKAEKVRLARTGNVETIFESSPASSSDSGNFPTDPSSGMTGLITPPNNPPIHLTNIHYLLKNNAALDIDYSDIDITPINSNLTEILEMSLNAQGFFDFTIAQAGE